MRKELIFILSLFFLIACNSGMDHDALKSSEVLESEESVSMDEAMPATSEAGINFEEIFSEKLQEYAELQQLVKTHPEFESELREQLNSLSEDSILHIGNLENAKISEIKTLEPVQSDTDSIYSTTRISFRITTDAESRIDTLLANIRKETVEIDGDFFTSTKVTFESLKN